MFAGCHVENFVFFLSDVPKTISGSSNQIRFKFARSQISEYHMLDLTNNRTKQTTRAEITRVARISRVSSRDSRRASRGGIRVPRAGRRKRGAPNLDSRFSPLIRNGTSSVIIQADWPCQEPSEFSAKSRVRNFRELCQNSR